MNSVKYFLLIAGILFLDNQRYGADGLGNELEALALLSSLGTVDASNYLKEVFENIKHDEASKLDPFILNQKIEEHVLNNNTNVTVVINPGFKIEGISKVAMDNFKAVIDFKSMKLDVAVQISLPELKGTGTYIMDGKAMKYFPVRGNGSMLIDLKGITGSVEVVATFNGNQFVADVIQFKLSDSAVALHFDNLIDANLSDFFNSLLNYLAKPLTDKLILDNQHSIDSVKLTLKNAIDKQLAHYDANTLLSAFQHI